MMALGVKKVMTSRRRAWVAAVLGVSSAVALSSARAPHHHHARALRPPIRGVEFRRGGARGVSMIGRGDQGDSDDSARLLLIRHGRTEMNEHLSRPGRSWASKNFADAGLVSGVERSMPRHQS